HTLYRLHADTDCIWKFQRYSLVRHHLARPLLPQPLIIISHIYRLIIYVFTHSPQEIILNKVKILETQAQALQNRQDNMFEYLQCLMNGMKKIRGDDIEMPKQCSIDSVL
ncbi:unnamed protein product, partial [Rotaria sordida]